MARLVGLRYEAVCDHDDPDTLLAHVMQTLHVSVRSKSKVAKNSDDSMQHAHYSLLAQAVVVLCEFGRYYTRIRREDDQICLS